MPSRQLFVNNAQGTLASGIASGATSVTLGSGDGARFGTSPSANEFIRATLRNAAGTVTELVNITAIVGDVLTIARAQESTTAQAFSAGDTISVRWTRGGAERVAQKDANETITGAWTFPAPAAAGDVVNKSYVDQFQIPNLTAEAALVDTDSFPFYDLSATAQRRVTGANLRSQIGRGYFSQTGALINYAANPVVSGFAQATWNSMAGFGNSFESLDAGGLHTGWKITPGASHLGIWFLFFNVVLTRASPGFPVATYALSAITRYNSLNEVQARYILAHNDIPAARLNLYASGTCFHPVSSATDYFTIDTFVNQGGSYNVFALQFGGWRVN